MRSIRNQLFSDGDTKKLSGNDFAEVFGASRDTISDGGRATAFPPLPMPSMKAKTE
jgi:hypothetical protein